MKHNAGVSQTPPIYRWCDDATEVLLLSLVVFAPWAFGCTVSGAISIAIGVGYSLGFLEILKWLIARRTGFEPPRWSMESVPRSHTPVHILGLLCVLIFGWALVSGWNGRATAIVAGTNLRLEYRDALRWLPHSFDAPQSLRAALRFGGLISVFWSAYFWFAGKSRVERRHPIEVTATPSFARLPDHVRRFLWTLILSSSLLAIVGVLQRFGDSDKLLWLIPARPSIETGIYDPKNSFGPYNYRGNAATYFNLVWPFALGLWWTSRRDSNWRRGPGRRTGSELHIALLPLTGLLMLCPLLTLSRGGILILAGEFGACFLIMMITGGKLERRAAFAAFFTFAITTMVGVVLAGPELSAQFSDPLPQRDHLRQAIRLMIQDSGFFGTGPETFTSLYGIYRQSKDDPWEAFAHNDYLETVITFGVGGSVLLLSAFACIFWLAFRGPAKRVWWPFPAFVSIAIAGLLVHASFDFPLQIYSLTIVFIIGCALLASLRAQSELTP